MTDNFTPEKNTGTPKMSLEEWKAMKDQEKSDIFKLLDQTTLDLAEVPGCFLRYLDTQARMNRYTVSNALLISAQMPEATKLRTFAEWEKEGAKIRKGCKSISILEPSEFKKADGSTAIAYNVKKVFDISQTSKAEEAKPFRQKDITRLIAAMLDTCPVSIDLATEIPVPNMAGPNHTLPTGGTARFSSPLSVDDFVKKIQVTSFTSDALEAVRQDVADFAMAEGLDGHARSALIRSDITWKEKDE